MKKQFGKLTDHNHSVLNSVLLGLFLSSSMITKIITQFVTIENNLVIVIALLLMISFFINRGIRITVPFLIINCIAIMIMLSSLVFNIDGKSVIINYILNFLLFGSTGMLLYSVKTEHKVILSTICKVFVLFSFITIFKYIPEALNRYYVEYSMEVSYVMLIGISAGVFAWEFAGKLLKIAIIFTTVISSYYLLFLSDCRGAVIAIIFLIVAKFLSGRKHKFVFGVLFLFLGLLFVIGWELVLDWLVTRNTEMRWILRFQRSQLDISRGRNDLYTLSLELIKNNLLFGNGIGAFESVTNGQYTHNLFLQFIVEFGVIFGVALSLYIIIIIVRSFVTIKEDKIDLFLICQFIPRLLLSSVYWVNPFFWLFLYKQILPKYNKKQ